MSPIGTPQGSRQHAAFGYPTINQEISWSLPGIVESSQNYMKCYLCAISCGVCGGSVGRKKGKKENHFLNSSYDIWKTFIHCIHLSGFHVITPGQKKNKNTTMTGWWREEIRDTGFWLGKTGMLSTFPFKRNIITKRCLCLGAMQWQQMRSICSAQQFHIWATAQSYNF